MSSRPWTQESDIREFNMIIECVHGEMEFDRGNWICWKHSGCMRVCLHMNYDSSMMVLDQEHCARNINIDIA